MKILFINPQQEMGGIQCLSAYLKRYGHQTELVNDPNLFDNPWIQFPRLARLFSDECSILEKIDRFEPDLIAFSVVTDDYPWALRWAERIKRHSQVPIVFGNAHPTFHPHEVLSNPFVDFVVRGEGEITLLELVEALKGNCSLNDVLGLGYKVEENIVLNEMRSLIEDMDILPFPDKDLYYREIPYLNHGYTTMTGRGCPYRCTFCNNNSSTKLYRSSGIKQRWTRRHSPDYVVSEILWAKERYDIQHIRFNDEDFSYNKMWVREFCEIYEKKVGLPWFAWVYPNTIDEEIAARMAQAGCDSVEMGIQSGSQRIREEVMHRNTKDEQIVSAIKSFRKHGIRVTVDVILGVPSETKADLDATVRLLIEGRPWHIYAFWLRYYPSTEILQLAREKNLLRSEQIARLEKGMLGRGHISGGDSLEVDPLARSYHCFIVLLPIMPVWFARACLEYNLIQFFPTWVPPIFLVNLTKAIKPSKFDEFRVRGFRMIIYEVPRQLMVLLKKLFQMKEVEKLRRSAST